MSETQEILARSRDLSRERAPQLEFHRTHLRGGIMPEFSVSIVHGYGAAGEVSLYLPSPQISRRWIFKNGMPEPITEGVLSDADIVQLRERVLKCVRTEFDPGKPGPVLFADKHLLIYSAAIIGKVYDVADDDLTMLHSGAAWIESAAVHAMGGADARDRIARLNIHRAAIPVVEHSADVPPNAPRFGIEPVFEPAYRVVDPDEVDLSSD